MNGSSVYGSLKKIVDKANLDLSQKVNISDVTATVKELIGYEDGNVYKNIAGTFSTSNVVYVQAPFTKTTNADGSVTITGTPTVDAWMQIYYKVPFNWLTGHSYFTALKISLDVATQLQTGSTAFSVLDARYNNVILCTNNVKSNALTLGKTTDLIYQHNVNTTLDTSASIVGSVYQNNLFIQPIKVTAGNTFTVTIRDLIIVDMGLTTSPTLTFDATYALFSKYGYAQQIGSNYSNLKAKTAVQADVALVAKSLEGSIAPYDIEIWGDSLVEQAYSANIASMTGRTVTAHGYGGRTSTYIRDMFLTNSNKQNSIIINVGRNNYTYTDRVLYDVRKMVAAIPHQRFIICCPPNGNYPMEYKSAESNHYFSELEARLQKEYPSNFINTRLATIYGYNMGGVTLTSSFVQPTVGNTVQITVSNTAFLTTYNTYDSDIFTSAVVSRIRIGDSFDKMDLYDVVSVDSATTMTVRLNTVNNIAAGSTVQNIPDSLEPTSLVYLMVIQEADYQSWIKEIPASTYRKDKVHMSEYGKQHLAGVLVKAIYALGL